MLFTQKSTIKLMLYHQNYFIQFLADISYFTIKLNTIATGKEDNYYVNISIVTDLKGHIITVRKAKIRLGSHSFHDKCFIWNISLFSIKFIQNRSPVNRIENGSHPTYFEAKIAPDSCLF